jgi:uncharacterized membrane protein
MKKRHLSKALVVILPLLIYVGLVIFGGPGISENSADMLEIKGVVVAVDNSELISSGVGHLGSQSVTVLVTQGKHKGEKIEASNGLIGSLEIDEVYGPGDTTLIAAQVVAGEIGYAKTISQYRQGWEALLFGLFILLLLIYAGSVGLKALISFVASVVIIWNFLLPGLLAGQNPLLITISTLTLLTMVIIFLVGGFTRKALAATLGTLAGLAAALVLTVIFGDLLQISGMTSPFAPTLLLSGHYALDMREIFYASVVIGASGAAMDIAMDVAASMDEVKKAKPEISARELLKSGLNVGRTVVGTMSTTLLLAYSGGYLTMLMLFVTKDTSLMRILNFKMVAAEIFRILVGSIGLVMVAPLTALIAAWLFSLAQDKAAISDTNGAVQDESETLLLG